MTIGIFHALVKSDLFTKRRCQAQRTEHVAVPLIWKRPGGALHLAHRQQSIVRQRLSTHDICHGHIWRNFTSPLVRLRVHSDGGG